MRDVLATIFEIENARGRSQREHGVLTG